MRKFEILAYNLNRCILSCLLWDYRCLMCKTFVQLFLGTVCALFVSILDYALNILNSVNMLYLLLLAFLHCLKIWHSSMHRYTPVSNLRLDFLITLMVATHGCFLNASKVTKRFILLSGLPSRHYAIQN